MIIIINNWKKKLFNFFTALVLVIAFAVAIPYLAGTFYEEIPVLNTWFQDENPSGNPLRVEKQNTTKFEEVVDYLVFQLQEFYSE